MVTLVTAVFCDDARADDSGTFIIFGAYPGSLTFASREKRKRIGNWIQITGLTKGNQELGFKVEFRNSETSEITVLAEQVVEIEVESNASVILTPSGLNVPRENGLLTLHMTMPGEGEKQVAQLAVEVNEDGDETKGIFFPINSPIKVKQKLKSKTP